MITFDKQVGGAVLRISSVSSSNNRYSGNLDLCSGEQRLRVIINRDLLGDMVRLLAHYASTDKDITANDLADKLDRLAAR